MSGRLDALADLLLEGWAAILERPNGQHPEDGRSCHTKDGTPPSPRHCSLKLSHLRDSRFPTRVIVRSDTLRLSVSALFVTLAILLVLVGILGTVVPGLPGATLVLAGLLWLAWLDGFDRLGASSVTLLVILTVASHATDPLATVVGAKRLGASRRAMGGVSIGTIVGLFFGLPGVVIGPFVGAFIGELTTGGLLRDPTRAGLGTWLGIVLSTVVKLALVFMMVGIAAVAFLFG